MRLYTCHIVKSIVFKSNVDEPCVNSVSEPCFNFVDEPCATSESGVLEGKFDYEFASRKPCSKSQFLDIDEKEMDNVNKGDQKAMDPKKIDEWKKNWGFDMETFMANLS